ncbi:MAG: AEC family transporter [Clostridia bacterium]|nr:AEC family transporter [Clostridia bacterium]
MLFTTTLNQMLVLVIFIAIGFIIQKVKLVPENSSTVVSKLENNLFIPALVLNALMYTENILANSSIILFGLGVVAVTMFVGYFIVKSMAKDEYTRTIYAYGIYFSNFSFMGNAVVQTIFPQHFSNYMLFTIPAQILVFGWAIPFLLTPKDGELLNANSEEKTAFQKFVKPFLNPTLICVALGLIFALTGFGNVLKTNVPFVTSVVSGLANCMSPLAMILTGMIIAKYDFKNTIKKPAVYILSALRLIVFPLVFGLIAKLFITDYSWMVCMVCYLGMPLGLSSVIIPTAYGKDTSEAATLALVSHVLCVATIPVIFTLLIG